MKCTRCGFKLSSDEVFCGECGTPRPRLPAPFEETERQFAALKARRDPGQLTGPDDEAALRSLVLQDDSGTHWMLGTDSGEWYRAEGQEWVRADPPIQSSIPPQKKPVTVGASPQAARRRLPCVWIALGGTGLVTVAVCGGLILLLSAARRPLEIPFAATAAPGSTLQLPAKVSTAAPRTARSLGTPSPAESRFCDGVPCYPVPADGLVIVSDRGLSIALPPGWYFYRSPNGVNAQPAEPDKTAALGVAWYSVGAGTTAEDEVSHWEDMVPNISWGEVSFDQAAIGQMAWCTGTAEAEQYYVAVAGPDAQNRVLYWFGVQHQAGVSLPLSSFKESTRRSAYTK